MKTKFKVISLGLLWISFACKSINNTPIEGGADSLETLQKQIGEAIQTGNRQQFEKLLVTKKEYVNAIHPLLPEKNDDAYMIYNVFISPPRSAEITKKFAAFKNMQPISKVEIESPKKTEKHGNVTLYHSLRLHVTHGTTQNPQGFHDDHFLGLVVEKGGKFKLLNCFRD